MVVTYFLNSSVVVKIASAGGIDEWAGGVIIGRTIEEFPHFDVKLSDGRVLQNLPHDRVGLPSVVAA